MSAVAETRQTLTSVLVCRPAEPVLPENLASDIRRGAGGVGGGSHWKYSSQRGGCQQSSEARNMHYPSAISTVFI